MSHYEGSVPTTEPAHAWVKDSLCARPEYAKRQDELWFATPGQTDKIAEAKRLCHLCPVRMECLRAEMDAEGNWSRDRRHGVRGGLDGAERHRLYKELQRRQQAEQAGATA